MMNLSSDQIIGFAFLGILFLGILLAIMSGAFKVKGD